MRDENRALCSGQHQGRPAIFSSAIVPRMTAHPHRNCSNERRPSWSLILPSTECRMIPSKKASRVTAGISEWSLHLLHDEGTSTCQPRTHLRSNSRVHPRRVSPTCQYRESPHLICPFSGLVAQPIRGDAPRGIAACDLPLKTKAPDMFLHARGVLIGVGPVEIGKGDLRRT